MYEKSAGRYNQLISRARAAALNENDGKVLDKFMKMSSMFCLSQTPASFYGVMLSTSFHEKTNDLIKSYISFERPINYVLQKTLKIMSELQTKSKVFRLMKFPI